MFLNPRLWLACIFGLVVLPVQSRAQAPEYRASWADGFHSAYLSATEVSQSMANMRASNCNVFVPEVRLYSDAYYIPTASSYPDYGAAGSIVTNGSTITCDLNSDPEPRSSSTYDALATVLSQAHNTSGGKARIDVWAWLVSMRSSSSGVIKAAHPDWLTKDSTGAVYSDTSGNFFFDPGHPGYEQQLVNVCMDLATHYDIDGLNFDYIRFTASNIGYNDTSVARFNKVNGTTGLPSTSDAAFKQWRRDQVTNLVRKIFLNVIAVKPNVKISADTIMWTPAPARPASGDTNPLQTWKANFQASSAAYNSVYQDWRSWMEEGIIDITMPMAYLYECSYQASFDKWCDFTKDNQFGRQCVIGMGGYLNLLADNLAQYARTRQPSSTMGKYGAGQNNYSYAYPYATICGKSSSSVADPAGWAAALKADLYAQPATVPALPRLTNGKGHIKGSVTSTLVPSPGWVDGGTVTLSLNANGSNPVRTMVTDGTGFYGFVDVAPGSYYLKVHATSNGDQIKPVTVTAATVSTVNFALRGPATQTAFRTQPAGAATGVAFATQPVVEVLDSTGNVVTGFTGPVNLSIKSGTGASGAVMNGVTTRNAVNGVAAFSGLSISKAGTGYVLTAASSGLVSSNSTAFDVSVVPTRLAFATSPAGTMFGHSLAPEPVVQVQDDDGNVDTTYTGPIALAIKTGTGYPGASLTGTTTVNAFNGSATFPDLGIDKLGYAYRLTATSGTLSSADSLAFDMVSSAVSITFSTQPGGARSGKVFSTQPVVVARNAAGETALEHQGTVNLSIKPGTGVSTAWLDGTTSADFVNGVAMFTDLAIGDPGTGYVLWAESGNLPGTDSAAFDVVDGGPFTIVDAIRALSIAGGLTAPTSADSVRLDVEHPGGVDSLDAVRITRRFAGLDPNP